ncbi:beta strand repeat-containing protein [Singulisphaera sp. PoT]|uniref:beta strand repeat-containing protein n=1 Tax=Singulisphaera sp. PoT TaxID=3411797 RepID=UPI003BF57A1C
MRPVASENDSPKNRGNDRLNPRKAAIRRSRLRATALEGLEERTLLSSIPAPNVPLNSQVDVSGGSSQGNSSTPSIAIDPTDPTKMAAVWTIHDPSLAPGPQVVVAGAYSNDGGQSWRFLGNNGRGILDNIDDPTTSNPIKSLGQATNASVAFDRNHNFYILDAQNNSATSGPSALVLNKYNFGGANPSAQFTNHVVYESLQDQALMPMLAVDSNIASFTDTDANGNPYVQSDPFSGDVYVAWATNNVAPTGATNYNPNQIDIVASSDGGNNFSGPVLVNSPAAFGIQRYTSPQLAISQGHPAANGKPAISGGQLTIVYDDFGGGGQVTPIPVDFIRGATAAGAAAPVIAGSTNPTTVAGAQNYTASVPSTLANFGTLSDLSVSVTLSGTAVNTISLVLIPPTGSGLQPVTLVVNGSISGANLGIATDGIQGSTIFSDYGARTIDDKASSSPYMGVYQPSGGAALGGIYRGATASQLAGAWTLQLVNTGTAAASVVKWSINLVSGMAPSNDHQIIDTNARGTLTGGGSLATPVTAQGIGPGISLASDNTLGAYSPNQGRQYLAFATYVYNPGTNPPNPSSNTDIYMLVSDDGGQSWSYSGTTPGNRSLFGTPEGLPIDDDNAKTDGYSESTSATYAVSGRTQFQPQVAVDNATGSVVLSWYDARNDAANARVATYLTASIDGGQTFSPQTFANTAETAVDAITGQLVVLGPVPDNQSAGNSRTDALTGFGIHQGLAVYDGKIHAIWSSNLNQGFIDGSGFYQATTSPVLLDIRTVTATIAAGPRIIESTMGPVGLPGDTVNPPAPEGQAPIASAFQITFDRPVDPSTFTSADVQVFFRSAAANASMVAIPVLKVEKIPTPFDPDNPNNVYGYTRFQVSFTPESAVGTYSYIVLPGIRDAIRTQLGGAGTRVEGNFMDQNADGTAGQGPASGVGPGDAFSAPTTTSAGSSFVYTAGQFFPGPYAQDTLPLIVAGPHLVSSNVPGTPAVTSDNLVQDQTVSAIDVTFDRDMRVGSFTAGDVLRVMGPSGLVPGPYTVAAAYNATVNLPAQVPAKGTLSSTLTIPDDGGAFKISDLSVQLDLSASSTSDMTAVLVAPDGTKITLFAGVGGNGQNFRNTILSDSAVLGIGNALSPFNGAFQPATPIDTKLSGKALQGTWTLQVTSSSASDLATLNSWSLAVTPKSPSDAVLAQTFRVSFPTQQLSGTYTVTLGSAILAADGSAMDANQNAGVDLLEQRPSGTSTPITYASNDVSQAIKPGQPVTSLLTVPSSFTSEGVTLTLNITYPHDPDLTAILIGPNGEQITLFSNVGATGTQANFTNTTFSDSASTPIQNGGPPFFGQFLPQIGSFGTTFGGLTAGTWKLQITDGAPTTSTAAGKLNSWSLTFAKSVPITGLGEAVADQSTTSFRIFNSDPTNPLTTNTWTAVGAASITNNPPGNGYSGSVSSIVVDPSDPSGNTVYVAGASGGVWKTNNFLTADPKGPTYIPLTNFGPTFGMNIGSIAVFGRNNDPNQSIIVAGTGVGYASSFASSSTLVGDVSRGVGFLMSMDGGATWTLLGGPNNQFAANGGTSTNKVLIDPHPTPDGHVIIYAAMSSGINPATGGSNGLGGLYRSSDSGATWQKLSSDTVQGTNATDISFDSNSATVNAVSNPTGNVNTLYVSFASSPNANGALPTAPGVYISPNRGQTLNLMAGGNIDPLIRNPGIIQNGQAAPIPVNNGTFPTANLGRIVLAKPGLVPSTDPNATLFNTLYEGWLYAAVASTDGNSLVGLYVTKDNGATWTKIRTGTLPLNGNNLNSIPTNNPNQPVYNAPGDLWSASNMSLSVDPTNPSVVYFGGSSIDQQSGLIRIDISNIFDSHSDVAYSATRPDGGALQANTVGGLQVQNVNNGPPNLLLQQSFPSNLQFINLLQDPSAPYSTNTTLLITNSGTFTNDGSNITWIPFDELIKSSPNDQVASTNVHSLLSVVDPLTGHSRLIVGDNQGVFTGVDINGKLSAGIGTATSPTYSRNGNLQLAQYFYGAAQPSNLGAQVAAAMLYGNGVGSGMSQSDPTVLNNGNLTWNAPRDGNGTLNGEFDGVGVQVSQQADSQGNRVVYIYSYPSPLLGGSGSDFFLVSVNGGPFVSRTTGLVQNVAQWPNFSQTYKGGIAQGGFTINPIDGNEVIIGSNTGQIFSTIDQGKTWLVIANPGDLDGSYTSALTYGAPDPQGPAGVGNLNNVVYAGTVGGHAYVTQTGGGTVNNGNAWTDISSGLDGSPVVKIVTDPTRGTHDAFAVTEGGMDTQTFAAPIPANQPLLFGPGQSLISSLPTISNVNLKAQDISVTVNIAYPAPVTPMPSNQLADIALFLIGPDGTRTQIVGAGEMKGQNMVNTTFDALVPNNPISAQNNNAPYTGTYSAAQLLTPYLNKNIVGDWKLEIDTVGTGVAGQLLSWSLSVKAPGGVYYLPDSTAKPGPDGGYDRQWHNITGDLDENQLNVFGDSSQSQDQLAYLMSMAVDWRYVIPDTTDTLNSAPHPMLYVAGQGGVFRSTDLGHSWTDFPNQGFDGSAADGGYLPNVKISDLNIESGDIDPTTGRAVARPGDPNNLYATTFGQGTFTIRLAPDVFPNTNAPGQPNNFLYLDPASDTGTYNNDGITNDPAPYVDGLSEQSAFGNTVTINLYDQTRDPNHLHPIGTGVTDAAGNFKVKIDQGYFSNSGVQTIAVQATDQSGTKGNVATFSFTLVIAPPAAPGAPGLQSSTDSGTKGDNTTNYNNGPNPPIFGVGGNSPGANVTLDRAPLAFASSAAAVIGDNASYTSTVNIAAGQYDTISKLTLDLSKISFSKPQDLKIVLTGPDGTTIPVNGALGSAINLTGLDGTLASGNYKLTILNTGLSSGTIGGWTLNVWRNTPVDAQSTLPKVATIPAHGSVDTTINVPAGSLPGGATIGGLVLDLSSLQIPTAANLSIKLTGPDGTVVPISAPYGTNVVAGLGGKAAAGDYKLTITNSGGSTGWIGAWALKLNALGGSPTSQVTTLSTPAAIPAAAPTTSKITIPASALANPSATIPGLVLDLTRLGIPDTSKLAVQLTGPDGTSVVIGGPFSKPINIDGFNGKAAAGDYTLSIINLDPTGLNVGSLGSWTIGLAGTNSSGTGPIAPGATATSTVSIPAGAFSATTPQPSVVIPGQGSISELVDVPASTLTSASAKIQSLVLDLSSLKVANTAALTITLAAPDGTTIVVPAPYGNSINLTGLAGHGAAGTYKLTIAYGGGTAGTLGAWTLKVKDDGAGSTAKSYPLPTIADGLVLDLSQFNAAPNATITLKGPDGTVIPVVASNGRYVALAGLNGRLAAGTYTLSVTNNGSAPLTLGSWSLSLPGTITSTVATHSTAASTTGSAPLTVLIADTNNGQGTIPNGVYLYTAAQSDLAGNLSPVGLGQVVTIDATPPAAPAPALTLATDSGQPGQPRNLDDITNVAQPDFQGTTEPNATVTLYVNGVAAGTAVADANGHYLITSTIALNEGLNNITIKSTDLVGNLSATSPNLVVRLDTTPPDPLAPTLVQANDTGFSNTDGVTYDSTPSFSGKAEVSAYAGANGSPLSSGTLVKLFAQLAAPAGQPNNNPVFLIGEALADPVTGQYTVTVGQYITPQPDDAVKFLPDGSYNISALQYDIAGNQSRSLEFGNAGAVVIDGTDSPLHGDNSGPGGTNELGWLYMQEVLNLIEPNVSNGSKIFVALGVDPGAGFGLVTDTIKSVFAQSHLPGDGWTMVLVTGDANIQSYLSGGSAQAITVDNAAAGTISMNQTGFLYITTGNKLGDDLTNSELGILNQHGQDIKNFVNGGGGLYAQTELPSDPNVKPFGWLTSLFPGITPVEQDGGTTGLQITPEGHDIFPDVTTADFEGAIWHNYFTGTFDPLSVVVTVPDPSVSGQIDPLVLASSGSLANTKPSQITVTTTGANPKPPAAPALDATTDSGAKGDNITQFNNGPSNVYPAPILDVASVEAGARVQLFRSTYDPVTKSTGAPVLVNTVFNTGAASATVQVPDTNAGKGAIPDGYYIYTEQITDLSGVVDPISAGTQIRILATAPGTPATLALDASTDSGTYNNDKVTRFNNSVASPSNAPVFDVTNVAANLTVELFRGTKLVGTTASGSGGTVKVADTNGGDGTIADGTYQYHVNFVDVAGNISPVSASLTVVIDHTAPVAPSKIVLDPAADSGTLHNGTATNFNNDPSKTPANSPIFDVSGVEAHATVELYRAAVVNGVAGTPVLVGKVLDSAGGVVKVADTNGGNGIIPNGIYVYSSKQVDLAGNTEDPFSPTTTVTINATAPVAPGLRLDAGSDTGSSNSDGITQITLFHFPTFDLANVVKGGSVELLRDGKVVASLANTAGGTIQLSDTNSLADGSYTYAARQTDLEGNVSVIGTPITVVYDTKAPIAPAAPVLDPASDSGTKGDSSTSSTAPTFDLSNVEAKATVKLMRDGVVVATVTNAAPVNGILTIKDPGPVGDGSHVYTALQTDVAGNVSPISAGAAIDFRPDAPTGVSLDVASDSGVKGDNITNVTSLIIDVTGVAAGSTVNLIRNGLVVASIKSTTGGTVKITDPGPLDAGQYVYAAQQVGSGGSGSQSSPSFTLTVKTSAQQPALILDPGSDSGTQGDDITNVTNPSFDISNVAAGATVTLTRGGKVVATTTSANGGTVVLKDSGPLTNGDYDYLVTQTDVAGNVSLPSPVLTLTVNTTLPQPPTLALDPSTNTGSKTDSITSSTQPIIDLTGINAGATVALYRGGVLIHTFTNVTGGTASYKETAALAAGTYNYTATQTNSVGSLSLMSNPLSVTIDNSVPKAPGVVLDPSSATIDATTTRTVTNVVFDVSGIVPGGVVTLFRDGKAVATATSSAGGTIKLTDPGKVPAGQHSYTAQQTSGSGIQGPAGATALKVTFVATETVLGDYIGNGQAQFAIYRRDDSTGQGTWFIPNVTSNSGLPYGSAALDVPVQGDFLGTGKDQIALYRPSTATWLIPGYTGPDGLQYGKANDDIPVPGDYYGIGSAQVAVYRASTGQWFVGGTANPIVTLGGQPGDIPVPGYYDGPTKFEAAVYRPSTGQWFIQGHSQPIQFGSTDKAHPDIPVPGDYDGVGHTQLALFRPSTQQWFIGTDQPITFGGPGDIPVPGQYFGNGKDQIAVYRQGNPGTLYIGGVAPIQYGGPQDFPVNAPYSYRKPGGIGKLTAQSADFGVSAVSLSTGQGSTASAGKGSAPARPSLSAATANQGSTRIRPQADVARPSVQSLRQFIAQRRLFFLRRGVN